MYAGECNAVVPNYDTRIISPEAFFLEPEATANLAEVRDKACAYLGSARLGLTSV
jgi:hypothetical protein